MYIKEPTSKQVKLQHTLQQLAYGLRSHMTAAELLLWQQLKNKQLGYKFRSQYPLFQFIADFYCSAAKLVIEVDGEIHTTRRVYDRQRDRYLTQAGYTVIRFKNEEVTRALPEVVETIKKYLPCKGLGGKVNSGIIRVMNR